MLIGALAASSGVPTKTIRFYEAEGLLEPPRRDRASYRRYAASSLDRLVLIRAMKSAGYSLADIRELTEAVAADRPIPELASHLQLLDNQLDRLHNVRAEIAAILHASTALTDDEDLTGSPLRS